MITDHSPRARVIDFMEAHAPARSRELAAIGVAATAISRAVAEGAVVASDGAFTNFQTENQICIRR